VKSASRSNAPESHEVCTKQSGKTRIVEALNCKWQQRQSGLTRTSCGVSGHILDDLTERFLILVDRHVSASPDGEGSRSQDHSHCRNPHPIPKHHKSSQKTSAHGRLGKRMLFIYTAQEITRRAPRLCCMQKVSRALLSLLLVPILLPLASLQANPVRLESDSASEGVLRSRVQEALSKGDWTGADRLLTPARNHQTTSDSDAAWAASASVLLLRRQGKWEEALRAAEDAAKRFPGDADIAGLLAVTRFRSGDVTGARQAVDRLEGSLTKSASEAGGSGAPTSPSYWARVAQGRILFWDGRLVDACRALARTLPAASQFGGDAEAAVLLDSVLDEIAAQGLPEAKSEENVAWRKAVRKALAGRRLRGHPFEPGGDHGAAERQTDPGAVVPELPSVLFVGEKPVSELRVPFERRKDGLWLTVAVAGRRLRLQIDSGGGDDITLYKSRIKELRLPKGDRSVTVGLGGRVDSERQILPVLEIGKGQLHRVPVDVVDQEGEGEGDDGLMGLGLLRRFQITLDLKNSELVLLTSAVPPDSSAVVVPFHVWNGMILLSVRHETKGEFWAAWDTGAGSNILSRRQAAALMEGMPKEKVQRGKGNRFVGIGQTARDYDYVLAPQTRWTARLAGSGSRISYFSRAVFGISLLDEEASPPMDFEVSLLLGMPFLNLFDSVTLDYTRRELSFVATKVSTESGGAKQDSQEVDKPFVRPGEASVRP
jgi:hypothetical protein